MARGRKGEERWKEVVSRLDDDAVRCLLIDAAERSEDVARAVRLAAADSSERLLVLKGEIDRGLRTRRYLGYRESGAWAVDASPVVEALEHELGSEPSPALVVLLKRAIGHVVKVILRADDSDGMIGDLARRLLDLHERACDAGVADPMALAKWMIRFNFDDQDFFAADPVRYAAALGDEGLATFRREVAKRAADSSSFAAKYALERLAVADGDVVRIVSLLGGDLSSPYQFIQVAEAMGEIGRTDDLLAWARRGIETTTGWQVAKLFDLSARVLDERGDAVGVVALRREEERLKLEPAAPITLDHHVERLRRDDRSRFSSTTRGGDFRWPPPGTSRWPLTASRHIICQLAYITPGFRFSNPSCSHQSRVTRADPDQS